jgi:hypothetical protein
MYMRKPQSKNYEEENGWLKKDKSSKNGVVIS